jgi:hypothetical protein
MSGERTKFRFCVVGRFESRLAGNESQVIVSVLTGRDEHLVFSGSLTMTETEWHVLSRALEEAMGDDVELEDRAVRLDRSPRGRAERSRGREPWSGGGRR